MVSVAQFEAARPHMIALAFRLLGSVHDAEDAVQTTWIKASTAGGAPPRNPAAWLTTVLTRTCLDQLRARHRRDEHPTALEAIPAEQLAVDEDFLHRENIARALMVILDRLTPQQRVAYVLHDLFAVPFDEVAQVLDTSVASAKQHASRARRRIDDATPPPSPGADGAVVEAFLTAAAGGDMTRMLALLTDDCRRVADPVLLPADVPAVVTGAAAVAEETTRFVDRIRASAPILFDGRSVHVIAPGGHPVAILDVTVTGGLISGIEIVLITARHPPIDTRICGGDNI